MSRLLAASRAGNSGRLHPLVCLVAMSVCYVHAAEPTLQLSPVVVSATRVEQSSFDLPVSVDVVDRSQIQDGQARVNLSESLVRVPGIVVQNRQNYAQDLQISSRGFGARSTFGVRGVRLIADGIPATMPDGQGQAATFNLGSARRIEVLRGPFSALYGNSSGGVIQVFTEDGPQQPTVTPSLVLGSYDTSRGGIKFGGQTGQLNYLVDLSRFETNGYRDHSATTRDQFNSKLGYALDQDSVLTLIVNGLSQPNTEDPLGLNKAQALANPRQVDPAALTFNTRKSIEHKQGGVVYERRLGGSDSLRALGYYGQRTVTQFQSIPVAPQANPLHPGGVIDLDRDFGGVDLRWTHKGSLAKAPVTLTAGINYDRMAERRKGLQNFVGSQLGVQGALRRDENNTVTNFDQYLQAEWQPHSRWIASAGVRHSEVKFDSKDYYIVGANPDDSGSVRYRSVSPVAGLVFRLAPGANLYASAGKGFETPTFVELAYRPGGATGLNFALQPAKSRNYEIGVKAFVDVNTRVNLALFKVNTTDEIVVLTNVGGRATFQNASRTERQGLELSVESLLSRGFNAYAAYTYLDATYAQAFLTCVATPCATPNTPVAAGNRIPGVPRTTLYGELQWKHAPSGFFTALEARWNASVYVNDVNSEFADSYAVANWRAGFEQNSGGWQIREFVRIDNLFDKQYIGSVIVNEGNGRFYEPSPRRNYLVGVSAALRF